MHLNNYKIIAHTYNCFNNIQNNVGKCNALNRVNSVKYLGLFIDNKLKWDVHLNYINTFFYIYI